MFQWRWEARGGGGVKGIEWGKGGGVQGLQGEGHLLMVRVHMGQTLTRTEYWDRVGGERNITFKAFFDFRRAKTAYHGLEMGSFHLFVHSKPSSIILGKTRF